MNKKQKRKNTRSICSIKTIYTCFLISVDVYLDKAKVTRLWAKEVVRVWAQSCVHTAPEDHHTALWV